MSILAELRCLNLTLMLFTKSFQGRFLIVAALLGISLLAMAIYTKNLVRDDTRQSSVLVNKYKKANESLKIINDQYLNLKGYIYQYSLMLSDDLKDHTVDTLLKLEKSINSFRNSGITNQYPVLKDQVVILGGNRIELDAAIKKLLLIQSDARNRYPAVKILVDELQPTNRHFLQQMELARAELDDMREPLKEKVVTILNKIRYNWARRISEVRLFIANRSGTFGDPEKVLPRNIRTEILFAEQIDELLEEIRDLAYQDKNSLLLPNAINEMIITSRRYSMVFHRAVDAFMKRDWRADVFFLEKKVDPLLKKNIDILHKIETSLSTQVSQKIKRSSELSDVVTTYLWWFVLAVYFLLMLSYLAFEKMIRQPLLEVAKAMEAQGNNEEYKIPDQRFQATESEVLIEAFSGMKEQVNSRQLRLQSILLNASEGIVITDRKGLVETFNPAAERLFEMDESQVLGEKVTVLLQPGSEIRAQAWLKLWTGKNLHKPGPVEVKLKRPDGSEYTISIKISSMMHLGESYYIAVVSDISERKALVDKLQTLADMDSLTGLHNRRYFTEELERLVGRSLRRNNYDSALLYIDLDNFKYVNDSFGHHAGDRVLIEVSTLLQERLRQGDLLARLGGDEFAVILYNVDHKMVKEIAENFLGQITKFTFLEQGKVLDVGCTIGVCMLEEGVDNRDEFLMRADFACQLAKQMGRNRVYHYSQEDSHSKEQMLGHIGTAQKIKDAIREDQFVLMMQPILHVENGKLLCYEVLLRLMGDNGKLIMPSGFLPSAERFNLMQDVDAWVVCQAIAKLSRYQKQGQDCTFSINLSAQSLGDFSMINLIEDLIEKHQVLPASLIFEITENIAISNMENATLFLQHLQGLGCKTALDDFGAGYSSYAYLKDLPADYVKIDGGFVQDIDRNEFNLAMVRSMNDIAHIMGKKTIAEFVENEAVLDLLRGIGVDCVQGYYTGRPSEDLIQSTGSRVIPFR